MARTDQLRKNRLGSATEFKTLDFKRDLFLNVYSFQDQTPILIQSPKLKVI